MVKLEIKAFNNVILFGVSFVLSTVGVSQKVQAEQITNVSQLTDPNPMGQITNVSQLKDVQATDWAYEALRSLVERYGCIVGYHDVTYRGNKAISRWEFAAGLNACLNTMERLISEGGISKDEIAKLRKLVQEFQPELVALRAKVDNLESRTAFLENHQFSTTTKLSALVFMNITAASAGGDVKVEANSLDVPIAFRAAGRDPVTGKPTVLFQKNNAQATFSALTWLNLNTSFNGKDTLVTQLAAGNGNSPANVFASAGQYNTFGVPYTDQSASPTIGGTNVIIRELFYSFPVADNLQITVGPRVNWYRYFDNNRFTFFLTGAGSFNSGGSSLLNTFDRGSGAIVAWQIAPELSMNVGYLAEATEFLPQPPFNTASDPKKGLFGGTNSATVELSYAPSKDFTVRVLYNRSTIQALGGTIGGTTGEPLYGTADAGPGHGLDVNPNDGGLRDSPANTVSVNFDWLVTPNFGLFGRYSYGNTILKPINQSVNAQTFQAGLAFPDLGKEGALGTVSFLIPFDVLSGQKYLVSNIGDGGTQYEIEATYFYPVTNNIALVPAVYFIGHPNNFSSNPSIIVGNMRLQFSF